MPVPSSKPALIASRGAMSTCQWNSSVPRGAERTQRFICRPAPSTSRRPASARPSSSAPRSSPVEARLHGARNQSQLERRAGCPGAEEGGLLVDRDEPIPPPHLLDDHVLEQVAPHRALVVGGEALALAGDRGRDEREREELGVGVREGRAGVGALVDAEVDEGGVVGVGGDPGSPGRDRALEPARVEVGERAHVPRRVDDHLVGPVGGGGLEQLRLAHPGGAAERVGGAGQAGLVGRARADLVGSGQHRVEVGDRSLQPARAVGGSAAGPVRPDLGRGAILAALAEGTGRGGVGRRLGARRRVGAGTIVATRREQRTQAGELVDPYLGEPRFLARLSGNPRSGC